MVQVTCFGLKVLEVISWGRWAWQHGLQWKTGQRGKQGPEEGAETVTGAIRRERVSQGADSPPPFLPLQEAKVLSIDCQLLFSTDSLPKKAIKSVHNQRKNGCKDTSLYSQNSSNR